MTFLKKNSLILLCVVFALGVYAPLVIHGGLIGDDLAILAAAQEHPGILPTYHALFGQFTNRPLAPLVYGVETYFFGQTVRPYIALNCLLWLLALAIVARIINRYVHAVAAVLFFFFAAVPFLSSTILLSPALMIIGSVSLLCWACSLACLVKYLDSKQVRWYVSSYLLLLIALLVYEISLPLFVVTAFFPLVVKGIRADRHISRKDLANYLVHFVLPIIVVLVLVLLYQKVLVPHLFPDISRLRFRGLVIIPAVFSKFLAILAVDIPVLLTQAILRMREVGYATVSGLLLLFAGLVVVIRRRRGVENVDRATATTGGLLSVFALTAGSSIVLYLLAGTVPTIHGYDNRGLISFGISIAGVCALVGYYAYLRRSWVLPGMIVLLAVCSFSFVLQRIGYRETTRIQTAIIQDSGERAAAAGIGEHEILLVDVPTYRKANYNNEVIFSDEQDAKLPINIAGTMRAGVRLTQRRIEFGRVRISGENISIDDVAAPMSALWLYRANEQLETSLVRITNQAQLETILAEIATRPPPALPFDAWKEGVRWYAENINVPDITAYYAQYRERWGYN